MDILGLFVRSQNWSICLFRWRHPPYTPPPPTHTHTHPSPGSQELHSYYSTLDDTLHSSPDFPSRTEQKILSMRITVRIFASAICELDVAKTNGPDCIPSIVLKMCSPQLSPLLAKLYNKCLFESCFTSCWELSSGVPAYKNDGERSDPGNYRPIRLLPIMSKIFESFVNDRISKYLEGTGIFSDLHYGFRAFRSTADLLTVLGERI